MPRPCIPMRHRQHQRHPGRPGDVERRLGRKLHAMKLGEHVRDLPVIKPDPGHRTVPRGRRLPPGGKILVVGQHAYPASRHAGKGVGQDRNVPGPARDGQRERREHRVDHVGKAAVDQVGGRTSVAHTARDPDAEHGVEHGRGAQAAMRHQAPPRVVHGGDYVPRLDGGSLHDDGRSDVAQQLLKHIGSQEVGRVRLETRGAAEDHAPGIGRRAQPGQPSRVAPGDHHLRGLPCRGGQVERGPRGKRPASQQQNVGPCAQRCGPSRAAAQANTASTASPSLPTISSSSASLTM